MKRVTVNGQEAKASATNFSQWEAVLSNVPEGAVTVTAKSEDVAGNMEKTAHIVKVESRR